MSYTYGFFDAIDLGGGNYDREYTSAEFSHYWALLVGDGVFGQPSTSLNVLAMEPVAMRVKVAPGTGWIKGHYLTVPDNMVEVIAIPVANPSLPRIDSIIMALNNPDRDMKLYVRSGTAAVSPNPVTLQRDADVWELELAQITVAAGAGNITQTDIKDMRTDPNRCGIVTGLIDQFDVSGFFTAAQASFNEWFENVQGQLDGDVAGNLQNQINKNAAGIATINATTLKADTKTALGIPASAGPDDAFKVLANVGNLHVWENKQLTDVPAHITENAVSNLEVFYATAGSVNPTSSRYSITYYVADSITVNDSGDITLSDPTEVTCYIPNSTYSEYYNADALKGKYIKVKGLGSSYVYNRVLGSGVFKIAQNAEFFVSNPESYTGMVTVDKAYSCVGIPLSKEGTITYLTSTDRNAYTDGTVGNTVITYLGQLGGGARIEVGSYVGTGTYGASNPNSLTFGFDPKIVFLTDTYEYAIIIPQSKYGILLSIGSISGQTAPHSYFNASTTKHMVSYWSESSADKQMNVLGRTVHCIAIG